MLFLYSIFLSSLFGKHAALASTTTNNNDDAVMSMVNDLNAQYANGKPSGKQRIIIMILDINNVRYLLSCLLSMVILLI